MRIARKIFDAFNIGTFNNRSIALIIAGTEFNHMLPIIAIIGRPNVGKSTFFNRLIGKRYAITSPVPGTTRDRVCYETALNDYRAILIDTGGLDFDAKKDGLEADVQRQSRIAIEEADIIFFIIDATEPLTAADFDCAHFLRKSKKPLILIAHKADNKKSEMMLPEFYELGLGEAIPVSSIHNMGIEEVEDAAAKFLKKLKIKKIGAQAKMKSRPISIAIVGKPNVGKSSLVNSLLGEKRLIVSETPGTTIDATDTSCRFGDQDFMLIDTAGLRRRGKIGKGIEQYGFLRALRAISRAEIICLVLDYETGIANQDLHVSNYILEANKGLIVAVNKSDLMEDAAEERKRFLDNCARRMNYMPWAPVIFVSALNKKNIYQIFELAKNIALERNKKIPAKELELFLKTTIHAHPPIRAGKSIIISKIIQTDASPPTFTFAVNKPDLIHFSYRRFLENELRRKFGFYGTAIKLDFKE